MTTERAERLKLGVRVRTLSASVRSVFQCWIQGEDLLLDTGGQGGKMY